VTGAGAIRLVLLVFLLGTGAGAGAQTLVSSPAPDSVAVTVYRDPGRSPSEAPSLQWLNGYALISETRRVSIPAGESTVRFEGVASGILPQSAIVGGFPEGIVERNRDAYLLSPGTLLERSLGRRVHLRRTSLATGAVREQEAVIRSSADGALVLQTEAGFEALRCTGIPETPAYEAVPPELSPRPTLSVRVRSSTALTATVTLSYLATGFDWQANYVANLSPDGEHADLLAWLTLASTDDTSFTDASAYAVAGNLNRGDARAEPPEARPLTLRCWPQGRTHEIPLEEWARAGRPPRPPPSEPYMDDETVVVTGSRVPQPQLTATSPITIIAQQEALGDVKLYRIPEPVTVAANSQKQVAFLVRERVRVDIVYRQPIELGLVWDAQSAHRTLVTRNREAEGLGVALPAGRLVLLDEARGRPIVLGEGFLYDRAVGEDVEIEIAEATGVNTRVELVSDGEDWNEYRLTATNGLARPVDFEAEFGTEGDGFRPSRALSRRDGRPLWTVSVPANGTASLSYRVADSVD
jgi:hypothetical protein